MRETGDGANLAVSEQLEALRAERDALLQRDISTWLADVKAESTSLRAFQTSISWRITKPIRLAGAFSRTVKDAGLGAGVGLAMAAVKKRVRGR